MQSPFETFGTTTEQKESPKPQTKNLPSDQLSENSNNPGDWNQNPEPKTLALKIQNPKTQNNRPWLTFSLPKIPTPKPENQPQTPKNVAPKSSKPRFGGPVSYEV